MDEVDLTKNFQDARLAEALKLIKAFFSIEDDTARRELIEMAERFSNLENSRRPSMQAWCMLGVVSNSPTERYASDPICWKLCRSRKRAERERLIRLEAERLKPLTDQYGRFSEGLSDYENFRCATIRALHFQRYLLSIVIGELGTLIQQNRPVRGGSTMAHANSNLFPATRNVSTLLTRFRFEHRSPRLDFPEILEHGGSAAELAVFRCHHAACSDARRAA